MPEKVYHIAIGSELKIVHNNTIVGVTVDDIYLRKNNEGIFETILTYRISTIGEDLNKVYNITKEAFVKKLIGGVENDKGT